MTSNYWMEVENHTEMKAKRYYFSSRAYLLKALSQTAEKLPGWEVRATSEGAA